MTVGGSRISKNFPISYTLSSFQSETLVVGFLKSIFLKNFYSFSHIELRESGIENQEPFLHQTRMFALLWERVYFRNAMKKQNTGFLFNFYLFTLLTPLFRVSFTLMGSAFGSTAQYDIRITQYGSIKIERLCKTNPISEKPKMNLNHYTTKNYENKSGLLTMEKQTQSNPICSELVEPISKGRSAFGLKRYGFLLRTMV
jgi:hypothetical protein